jgi:hypothetical protein
MTGQTVAVDFWLKQEHIANGGKKYSFNSWKHSSIIKKKFKRKGRLLDEKHEMAIFFLIFAGHFAFQSLWCGIG